MGYYIETNSNHGKAKWLCKKAHGRIVTKATPSANSIPVVVIDSGTFEAAGIAFNERELLSFYWPNDRRPKTIVMVPREEVIRLCPEVEPALDWNTAAGQRGFIDPLAALALAAGLLFAAACDYLACHPEITLPPASAPDGWYMMEK